MSAGQVGAGMTSFSSALAGLGKNIVEIAKMVRRIKNGTILERPFPLAFMDTPTVGRSGYI